MMKGGKEFGYSLHHVNEKLDEGHLIDIRTKPLDYSKKMLANMESRYEIGVDMVIDAVEKFTRGGDVHEGTIPQDPEKAGYYTFPTEAELETCVQKGIKLVDGEEIKEFLVRCFGGGRQEEFGEMIGRAEKAWYAAKESK
jgi:methionyl-tRNA formyltransferase